jgi:hypothetical protein
MNVLGERGRASRASRRPVVLDRMMQLPFTEHLHARVPQLAVDVLVAGDALHVRTG